LGYNKDEKAEFKKKKEATIKVWGAYQENMRITSALFDKLAAIKDDDNIEGRMNEVNHEMETALSDMENAKRETNADTRVYSTIDIKVQQFKEGQQLLNKYFNDMLAFKATNPTIDQGIAYLNSVAPEIIKQGAAIKQRDSARLAIYYEGLNKEYDIVLPLNKKPETTQ
jgi:hypothetical protein